MNYYLFILMKKSIINNNTVVYFLNNDVILGMFVIIHFNNLFIHNFIYKYQCWHC